MLLYLKYLLLFISVLNLGFNPGLSQSMPESKLRTPRGTPQEIEFELLKAVNDAVHAGKEDNYNMALDMMALMGIAKGVDNPENRHLVWGRVTSLGTNITIDALNDRFEALTTLTAPRLSPQIVMSKDEKELIDAFTKKDRTRFFLAYDKLDLPMLDHAEKEMIYLELKAPLTTEKLKHGVEGVLVDSLGNHSKDVDFAYFNATYSKAHDFLHLPALDDDSRMNIQARMTFKNEISLGYIKRSIKAFAVDKTNKALVMNGSSSDEMFKAAYELLEELLELPELEPVHMQMVKSDLKSKDTRQDMDHIIDAVEDCLLRELLVASKQTNDTFITAYTEYQDFLGLPYVNENSTKMMIRDIIKPIKKATIGAMKRKIKGFGVEKLNKGLTMDGADGDATFAMAYKLLHLPEIDKDNIKTKLKELGNTTVDMDDINKVYREHIIAQVKEKGISSSDMIIWYRKLDLPKIGYLNGNYDNKGVFWQNMVDKDYTLPTLKAAAKAVVKRDLKTRIENVNNHINKDDGFIETYRTLGLPNLKNKYVLKVQSNLQNLSRTITMEDVKHSVKDQLMTQINRAMERDDDEKFKWAFTNLPGFDEQVVKESEALMAKSNLQFTGLNMFDYEDVENAARTMDERIANINVILAEENNVSMTQRFIKTYRFLRLPKIKEATKPTVKASLRALKMKTKRDVNHGDIVRAVEDGLIADLIVAIKDNDVEFISTYTLLTELSESFPPMEDARIRDIKSKLSQMNYTVLSGDVRNISKAIFIEDLNIAMNEPETDRFVLLYRMLPLQTEEVEIRKVKSYFAGVEGHKSIDDITNYYKEQLIKEMKQAVRNSDEEKFRQVYKHKVLGLPVIHDVDILDVLGVLEDHGVFGQEFVSIANLTSIAHDLLGAKRADKMQQINRILNNQSSSDSDFIEAWHGLGLPNLEDHYIMNMKSMLISANDPNHDINVTFEHVTAAFKDQTLENMKKASAENHHALFIEQYRLLEPEVAMAPKHTILDPESRLETMSESDFENGTSLTSALLKLHGVIKTRKEEEKRLEEQQIAEEDRKQKEEERRLKEEEERRLKEVEERRLKEEEERRLKEEKEDGLIADLIVAMKKNDTGKAFVSIYKNLTELLGSFPTMDDDRIRDIKSELSQMKNPVLSGDVRNIAKAAFIEYLNIAIKGQADDRFVILYRMLHLQTEEAEILRVKSHFVDAEGPANIDDFKDYYKDQLIEKIKQAVIHNDEAEFSQLYKHNILGLPVIHDVEHKNVLKELSNHGETFVSIPNLKNIANEILEATMVDKIQHINDILNSPSSDSDFIQAWQWLGLPYLEDRYIINIKYRLISTNQPMPAAIVRTEVFPLLVNVTKEHVADALKNQLIENMKNASVENNHALFVEQYRLLKNVTTPEHTILHPKSRLETMTQYDFENVTSLTSALQQLNGATERRIEEEEEERRKEEEQRRKEGEQRTENVGSVSDDKPKLTIEKPIVPLEVKVPQQPKKELPVLVSVKQTTKKLTLVKQTTKKPTTRRITSKPALKPTPKTAPIPDEEEESAPAAIINSATTALLAPRPLTLVLSCLLVTLTLGLRG